MKIRLAGLVVDTLSAWALHRLRVRRAQRDTRTASGWMTRLRFQHSAG
jgi:hypothetical protein